MHRNSILLFKNEAMHLFTNDQRILEIGPSLPSPYKDLVSNPLIRWETLDIYQSPNLTFVADNLYSFPIPSQTYDIVLSSNVIEHVKDIWLWMPEVARITKLGGLIITISPLNWGFHEYPSDCWRIFPDGMVSLYNHSGIKMVRCISGSLENAWTRLIFDGVKLFAKHCIKRATGGEPFIPIDMISIGRRVR